MSPAPPIFATTTHQSPVLLTRIAEMVTRYGLPVFILCLPLEVTAEVLRLQLARIVLLVVALAFAYLVVVRERKVVMPISPSASVLALFVAFSIVSWLFTRAPGSINPLLDVVAYPVMAVLVVNLTRTEKEHDYAWTALLVSAAAIAVLGASLHYTGLSIWRPDPDNLGRVNATFGDPNIAARFLTLGVTATILMFAARRLNRWLLISVAVAGAAVLPITFSKSGFIFFPVSVVLAALISADLRRGAAASLVILVIFGSAILIDPATRDRSLIVVHTFTGTTQNLVVLSSTTTQSQPPGGGPLDPVRTYLITAGWQMFKDHPLTGVGFGGFQHALETSYSRFLPPNPPVTLSHTSSITILAEEGIVGVVLMVGFLVLLAREVLSFLRRRARWGVLIATPAFLIVPIIMYSQLEGRFIEEPYLWLAFGLLYSAMGLDRSVRTIELP